MTADEVLKCLRRKGNRRVVKDALATDDNQWAAQLADYLLVIDKNDFDAKQIKADALTRLARNTVNATARNYYLTVARELREESKPE